jgi:hypothetical protein
MSFSVIDNREPHETTVAGCEGAACIMPMRCMIPNCLAPDVCKAQQVCVARAQFVASSRPLTPEKGIS